MTDEQKQINDIDRRVSAIESKMDAFIQSNEDFKAEMRDFKQEMRQQNAEMRTKQEADAKEFRAAMAARAQMPYQTEKDPFDKLHKSLREFHQEVRFTLIATITFFYCDGYFAAQRVYVKDVMRPIETANAD